MKTPMTKDVALNKLTALCSESEKCLQDVRKKLETWQVCEDDTKYIIDYLLREKYVDEARYARFYVRDKVHFSQWGKNKIAFNLRSKGISDDNISAALAELPDEDFKETMENVLKAKLRSIKYKDLYDAKAKLLRFGASRGFGFDEMMKLAEKLIAELKNKENDD